MISPTLYSSSTEEWETPQEFFNKLDAEFHFMLDAAATSSNTKCAAYLSARGMDALQVNWAMCCPIMEKPAAIFCNPPYGRKISQWFVKAREAQSSGALVVMLVPARTDTRWWHAHVQGIADEVRFVKGRLKFKGLDGVRAGAPFPSAVIIYSPPTTL